MSAELKLTPWFDGAVKPKRKGVYQRCLLEGSPRFALWTGRSWRAFQETADRAARTLAPSMYDDLPWRGLAENPAPGAAPDTKP